MKAEGRKDRKGWGSGGERGRQTDRQTDRQTERKDEGGGEWGLRSRSHIDSGFASSTIPSKSQAPLGHPPNVNDGAWG